MDKEDKSKIEKNGPKNNIATVIARQKKAAWLLIIALVSIGVLTAIIKLTGTSGGTLRSIYFALFYLICIGITELIFSKYSTSKLMSLLCHLCLPITLNGILIGLHNKNLGLIIAISGIIALITCFIVVKYQANKKDRKE